MRADGRAPAVGSRTGALPSWLTSFSGRDQALAALDDAFGRSRLVTVLGPGGAGKTRLATEFAARQAGEAAFVDLTGVEDGQLLAATVLGAMPRLDVEPPEAGTDEDALVQNVTARGPLLLVLDNCEQVALECGLLASRVLGASPELRILATSRRVLAAAGESVLSINGLETPAPGEERLEQLAASPAVALFVDRASLQAPSFVLDQTNAGAVAQICRLVDGLPLGIELAAPLVRSLSPTVITERLSSGRLVLQGPGLPERQRTFESLVDWSCALLSDQARTLLTRLGYFMEGFTLEAAEAVCAGPPLTEQEILPALTELVDNSLVHLHPGRSGDRYFLLETVRDYMGRKLSRPRARQPEHGQRVGTGAQGGGEREPPGDFTFTREGDVWLLGVRSRSVRLKASRGLAHLHAMISVPGREIHALELAAPAGGRTLSAEDRAELGNSGAEGLEAVDARALAAYKKRYQELSGLLAEAQANHDRGRQEQVRQEMGFLAEEVKRATGLGGRVRTTGSSAERARVAVTKAVRGAMARIADEVPELGAHLEESITTGARCSYRPRGTMPRWRL